MAGIAWYKKEQWDKLVSACEDKLSPNYESWLEGAEKALNRKIPNVGRVVKVEVDADESPKGLNIDGKARISFVNDKLGINFHNVPPDLKETEKPKV